MNQTSVARLASCDSRLVALFEAVDRVIATAIICGHRGEAEQDIAYRSGASKVRFPNSKHNATPSLAVDAAPHPIEWNDRERFIFFAGVVHAEAARLGIKLRWGGDWSGNGVMKDEKFSDLVHYEIKD